VLLNKEFAMKTMMSIGLVAVFLGAGLSGCARPGMMNHDSMHSGMAMGKQGQDMSMMGASGDGTVSKEEFMKHHEAMFDRMKKDGNGRVSMKDMHMMMMDGMMMKN
jgi:hypothetical protein